MIKNAFLNSIKKTKVFHTINTANYKMTTL